MTSAYLSLPDAARYLGRSPKWLRRRLSGIPHHRPDHAGILFLRQDLDEYMAMYRIDPREVVDRAVREANTFIREAQGRDDKRMFTLKQEKGKERGK